MGADVPNPHRPTLHPWFLGACVALLGMAISAIMVRQQAQSAAQVEHARLAQMANAVTEALVRRIDTFTEIAFGLRGLFVVNPELGRRAFVDAVSQLDITGRYPEVKNVAFTRYVLADQRQSFEAQVRTDTSIDARGYPAFSVHPPGARPAYFVAHYLWPMQGNESVHGLDISAQPANLASMQHSMRTGEPVASGPFELLQEKTDRMGFVIRVPVFRRAHDVPVPAGQGGNFLGSVAVTLRFYDLYKQLEREGLLKGVEMTLSDRGSSIAGMHSGVVSSGIATGAAGGPFASQFSVDLGVYSRKWHLDFAPTAPLLSGPERRASLLVGSAGAAISLLLGALVLMLARARTQALARAAASGEALEDSEDRWKFAIEGAGDGIWDWNSDENSMFLSQRLKDILGLADGEMGNDLEGWIGRIHPDDAAQARADARALLKGSAPLLVNEHRLRCKDGSWRWVLIRGAVFRRDSAGKPQRVMGTLTDIGERRRAAQVLQSSLEDKDALLKEVHHRVKNNLQVITSLLRLEGRRSLAPDTKAAMADMQGRIHSMALLHESLYRSGTFASVDLAEYLRTLTTQVFQIQRPQGSKVELALTLVSVPVGMDQALPCGLLVNELISNCLKHGFPDGRNGEVRVCLQPTGNARQWRLCVADDGVGMPADLDERRKNSLGLQLVAQLCSQIDGTLEVCSTVAEGVAFTVTFVLEPPAHLVMPA